MCRLKYSSCNFCFVVFSFFELCALQQLIFLPQIQLEDHLDLHKLLQPHLPLANTDQSILDKT